MGIRPCIGVMIAQPEVDCQHRLIDGIFKAAFQRDMNVAVFCTPNKSSCFGNSSEFERQIYELPNTKKLYGIVYVADTIQFEFADKIKNQLKNADCPVICVDTAVEGFPCIITKEDAVIGEVIRHLHEVHGFRDIAYMTGSKAHPHAEYRLNCYKKAMQDLNLPIEEGRTFYGDFWYDMGNDFVEQLLHSTKGLPEAIACASDRMAYSVYLALKERGIRVPEDIALTGYLENLTTLKCITSVGKDLSRTGRAAVEMIDAIRHGASKEIGIHYAEGEVKKNISLSCGCLSQDKLALHLPASGEDIENTSSYFSIYNSMKFDLHETSNFEEYFWRLDWYTLYLKQLRFISFCLCEHWNAPVSIQDTRESACYTPSMQNVYQRSIGTDGEMQRFVNFDNSFPLEDMHPVLQAETEAPAGYYFSPVITKKVNYGYAVVSFGQTPLLPDSSYHFWLRDVTLALESQKHLFDTQYFFEKMQKNAITDTMTGLFNRNGFNLMSSAFLLRAKEKNQQIAAIACDLNGLKCINDRYGHSAGDNALITSAKALENAHIEATEECNFRMGGDEYLKLVYGPLSDTATASCVRQMERFLQEYNQSSGKPYQVNLSIGMCLMESREAEIDTLLAAADAQMYLQKAKEH